MASVPEAKTALLALLRDEPALAGVQIEWAHPGSTLIEDECIYFANTDYRQTAVALGNRVRREDYALELVITVERREDDAEATERRCWDLLAGVESVLRANPTLTESVDVAQYDASPVHNFTGDGKRVAESTVRVSIDSDT